MLMTVGELFLESVSTGVITPAELNWVARRQHLFSRVEEAAAVRLGRLLDQGVIHLGCRLGTLPRAGSDQVSPSRAAGCNGVRKRPA